MPGLTHALLLYHIRQSLLSAAVPETVNNITAVVLGSLVAGGVVFGGTLDTAEAIVVVVDALAAASRSGLQVGRGEEESFARITTSGATV